MILIPIGGNAFKSSPDNQLGFIANNGIVYWSDSELLFRVFVHFAAPGKFRLSLNANSSFGGATIEIVNNDKSLQIEFEQKEFHNLPAGDWDITEPGYKEFLFRGIRKDGPYYPLIEQMLLDHIGDELEINYVRSNEDNMFYWGRRGASPYLNYVKPGNLNVNWFYNEIEIPLGDDVIGSYFMSNGFSHGYMGIQVISNNERWILFSVFNDGNINDPALVAEENRVRLVDSGDDVVVEPFGQEGTGLKSFKRCQWNAGAVYKLLVRAEIKDDNTTDFSGYFYCSELNQWMLIAKLKKPHTQSHLEGLYSFNENFYPEYGQYSRTMIVHNPCISHLGIDWIRLNEANFCTEAVGRAKYRLDFKGEVKDGSFFITTGGFFNSEARQDVLLTKDTARELPIIDHQAL